MISFLSDFIGIRDDIFLARETLHARGCRLLNEGYANGVLPHSPALLTRSDMDHPTQSMSDLLHLEITEAWRLKGKDCDEWAYCPPMAADGHRAS